MAASRRGRQRGVTLSVIVTATGIVLIALGTAFLSSAEHAYRLAALRAREAQLWASADAGLLDAIERLRRDPVTRPAYEQTISGAKVEVMAQPGDPLLLYVVASSGEGDLLLKRTLKAMVQAGASSGPRVLNVTRLSEDKLPR